MVAGQQPAWVVPQWEPGQGRAVALVTWALHSPLPLWISYLLLGPLLPPQAPLPLRWSVVNKIERVISKGNFVVDRNYKPGGHGTLGLLLLLW